MLIVVRVKPKRHRDAPAMTAGLSGQPQSTTAMIGNLLQQQKDDAEPAIQIPNRRPPNNFPTSAET